MTEDSPDLDLAPLTIALSKLTEDLARKIVQDRLPGLVEKMVEQMARDIIAQVAEKVARELVLEQAEAAVQKEIERLTAEV